MAEANTLGEYQELFFKLGGTRETADEFASMTDPEKIETVKKVYENWVSKYVNIEENTPEEKKQEVAEKSYFDKCEEDIANMDKNHPDYAADYTKATKKLAEDYEKAGWKSMDIGLVLPDGTKTMVETHYNPNSDDYKGLSESELQAKLAKEYLEKHPVKAENENQPEDKEDGKPREDDTLEITEDADKPAENQDENTDWIEDEEKYWRDDFCQPRNYGYERDAEQKEGLAFNIYKTEEEKTSKTPSARIHYKNRSSVSVSGKDGKTADYDIFKGLTDDAKRLSKKVRIDPNASPEFVSKLKLACLSSGVEISQAPEGKIDISAFADQLSDEEKRLAEEYNKNYDLAHSQENHQENNNSDQPAGEEDKNNEEDNNKEEDKKNEDKSYDDYLKDFEKDLSDGKDVDISNLEGKDKVIAYAAAMVASKNAQKDGVDIKGAPEKTVGYKNEKVFDLDENGNIKKDENGKVVMTENPLYAATKDLPEEAKAALEGHNQGVRQQQLEAARSKVNKSTEISRYKEERRRHVFRQNNHQYNEGIKFGDENTKVDRETRQAAMAQYWTNKKQND